MPDQNEIGSSPDQINFDLPDEDFCKKHVNPWPQNQSEQPPMTSNSILLIKNIEATAQQEDDGTPYDLSVYQAYVVASQLDLASIPGFEDDLSGFPHAQISNAATVEDLEGRMDNLMNWPQSQVTAQTAKMARRILSDYPHAEIYQGIDDETIANVTNDGKSMVYCAHYPIYGHSDDLFPGTSDPYLLRLVPTLASSCPISRASSGGSNSLQGGAGAANSMFASELDDHDSIVTKNGKRGAEDIWGGTEVSEPKRQHHDREIDMEMEDA
jgi:hypothetical protein